MCQSDKHDICPPYYCGTSAPEIRKPVNVKCVGQEGELCKNNCTGGPQSQIQTLKMMIHSSEPFSFGEWTETNECSENCTLMLERTCKPVIVDGLTPPSCENETLVMEGNTSCECVVGDILFAHYLSFVLLIGRKKHIRN